MANISWPSNTTEIIDAIRVAIGRVATFYVPNDPTPCTVCNLDPVTNTSTNSFCPVCSGNYWIYTYSGVSISGHITYGPLDFADWQTGGILLEGEARIQIKNIPEYVTVLDNTEWITMDDRRFEIKKVVPRGVQQINRLLIDVKELGK